MPGGPRDIPVSSGIREILVLHHSHLDMGYTHSQPVMEALQVEFIDQALDLLEETADWSVADRPTWTCESTYPVMWWLEHAAPQDVERFSKFLKEGRLGLSAMPFNGTPGPNAMTLVAQLRNKRILEERFGQRIRTANIHDVNGVPWALADLLIDEGVELLMMASNNYLGKPVEGRPGVFSWEAPSGRSILVMNGAHYTMFDQVLYTWDHDVERMERGWAEYRAHLDGIGYRHDFVYLTTTHAPEMWDNAPPNRHVAGLVRSWNEDGQRTPIRYIVPDDLLERIQALPKSQVPHLRGAWPDHWSNGQGARATELKLHRGARRHLAAAERIGVLASDDPEPANVRHRHDALEHILLYEEHTFSHYLTAPESVEQVPIEGLKNAHAYAGHELAWLARAEQMELLSENDRAGTSLSSIAFFNPSQEPQEVYVNVPRTWRKPGHFLRVNRFQPEMGTDRVPGELCGPIQVPAGSHLRAALAEVQPVKPSKAISHEIVETETAEFSEDEGFDTLAIRFVGTDRTEIIETQWYRVRFDGIKGRVLSIFDKARDREVLKEGATALFDPIRERTDALTDDGMYAYYRRDLDREKFDLDCWQDWSPVYERATAVTGVEVQKGPREIRLVTWLDVPSMVDFRRTITLRADSARIGVEVALNKAAEPEPEGIYLAIPLRMDRGWRCHFDAAGVPVELDAEQLPGTSRNFVSMDNYISMHQPDYGVTLFCRDAPLAMAGGFHFGRPLDSIPRPADPLLLAWPMNNYWDTNFARVQPGYTTLRYELLFHGPYDAVELARHSDQLANPVRSVPSTAPAQAARLLLACSDPAVRVQDVRRDEFAEGRLIVQLMNVSDQPVTTTLTLGRPIIDATRCRPLGQPLGDPLQVSNGNTVDVLVAPLETVHIRLRLKA